MRYCLMRKKNTAFYAMENRFRNHFPLACPPHPTRAFCASAWVLVILLDILELRGGCIGVVSTLLTSR